MNGSRLRFDLALPLLLLAAVAGAGCDGEAPTPHDEAHAPHTAHVPVALDGDRLFNGLLVIDGVGAARAALSSGELRLAPDTVGERFWRAGLRYETVGGEDPELEFRVERDGEWSAWQPVEVRWHEAVAFNAVIALDAPADRLAVRPRRTADASPAELSFFYSELFPEPLSVREAPAVEPATPKGRYATLEQGLAPPSFVNLRSTWQARNTGVCGSAHTPTWLTVHHTVTPTNDSMTPEQRMRQIQNYHIDSNGWCDIGYHFVVSRDGRIWQGRASHDHSAAHVGGHNTNNIGISFMGSFHIDQVPGAMIEGTAPLFAWFRDNYGIPLVRHERVRGHREWSGQSTACPGDFLLGRVQEIIDLANGGPKDDVVDVAVRWQTIAGQDRNFVGYGSSTSVFDMVLGQQVVGTIDVRNGVDRPATDDMIVGYWVQDPYLRALDYRILTDRAVKDGATFVESDQNGRADNPPASAPPPEGFIRVGSVQPGETVRIAFTLEAQRYSIGRVDHPDLRGWVKHIADYYGEQDSWDDPVEHNGAGRLLRAYAQLDIYSPSEWHFDGGHGDDVEGWTANADVDWLAVNLTDNALAYRGSGPDPYVVSPPWTRIDADRFGRITLRGRQHGGPRQAQLFWARDGEPFAEERSHMFEVAGDGQFAVYDLELAELPGWEGIVTQLRLDAWNGGPYTGAPAWFDVDYVVAVDDSMPVFDGDGDGAPSDMDCNDADPTIHPGADELCDGLDNNCDGLIDEDGACGGDDVVSPGEDTDAGGTDVTGPTDVAGADGTSSEFDAGDGTPPPALGEATGECCTAVRSSRGESRPWALALLLAAAMAGVFTRRRRRRARG